MTLSRICFTILCIRLYIFSSHYNFLIYYFTVFHAGLLPLNGDYFLLLKDMSQGVLVTAAKPLLQLIFSIQCSMDCWYFQIFVLSTVFNYPWYFSSSSNTENQELTVYVFIGYRMKLFSYVYQIKMAQRNTEITVKFKLYRLFLDSEF